VGNCNETIALLSLYVSATFVVARGTMSKRISHLRTRIHPLCGGYQMKRMIPILSILAGLALTAGTAQATTCGIDEVKVRGHGDTTWLDSVTVTPGISVDVQLKVKIGGCGSYMNHWRSSGWNTDGGATYTCVDIPNPDDDSAGTHYESFTITAPTTDGWYNLYAIAYEDNGCGGDTSTKTLSNAINMKECVSDSDCDDGNLCTDDARVAGTCQHTNNVNVCDDGDTCTLTDICKAGVCTGATEHVGQEEM
jgi:hypothetical protein